MTEIDFGKIISEAEISTGDIESQNRIDPKVMTAIMAMAQAGQLSKIRKNLENRASQGWSRGLNFNVTDTQVPPEGFILDHPAQSISIHNDGPATVFVGLNRYDNPTTLLINETLNVDFEAHLLRVIYLICPATLTATVRGTIKG